MPYLPFPTSEAESSYNTPNEINPGVTPGQWETIREPFQLSGFDYEQALAELDARRRHPRSGIPDDQFKQIEQERALIDQLSPFNVGMALGAEAVAPVSSGRNYSYSGFGARQKPIITKVGNDEYQYDDKTGKWNKVIDVPDKPEGLDAATKSAQALLESDIKAKQRALLVLDPTMKGYEDRKNQLALDIQNQTFKLHRLLSPKPAATMSMTPSWQVDPNSIPFGQVQTAEQAAELTDRFGGPGNRTPFMFSGAAAPPSVTQPTNFIRRTGRFNVYRNP